MKRNLESIASNSYDILIIGGGIYGAFTAWEAITRGLSVVLIEKNDFGSATSANSQKIIHGGFRYLQHADFNRMRESIRERTNLMRIAPHLIHPLPVLLPAYGHGLKGKEILKIALMLYDGISWDRNSNSDPEKNIPRGDFLSKETVLKIIPGLEDKNLTGGAVFYDAQVYNSERLILSILKSAHDAGAKIANYAEVTGFLKEKNEVKGVKVLDQISKLSHEIRAQTIINTSGPWLREVLSLARGKREPALNLVKSFNLVTKKLFDTYAVGLYGKNNYQDQDAILNKGARLFFVTPWRNHSVIGTSLSHYSKAAGADNSLDKISVNENEIHTFLHDFNEAYPHAQLKREDVSLIQQGFLPGNSLHTSEKNVQIAKHYQLIDHAQDGLDHLISVLGVKYTTARDVAQKVIDRVFQKIGRPSPPSKTAYTPIYGGNINQKFIQDALQKEKIIPKNLLESLMRNYGSNYSEVLNYLANRKPQALTENLSSPLTLLEAEVLHGVHEEMAQTLKDTIFRRTELGTLGHPGKDKLEFCARVMGAALEWNPQRIQTEIQTAHDSYPFMT